MAETLNLGNGNWAVKKDSLLAYNSENGNFKPLPFNFTRASSATVVNKDGLIEIVGSGKPRIDFKDDAKGALLLEPQRSNSFSYSEPIANSGSASGISYESFIWSLGFTNCVKFGDNSAVRFRYGGSVLASTQYTVSAFVVMDDLSEPLVGNGSSVGDFSFVAGGIVGGVVNSNVYYGNNIYRVSTTLTSGSNLGNNGVIKYTTQSSKGFRITGFQAEVGSYPTSYIPTQGSAVTRVAETAIDGAAEAPIFSNTSAVWFIDFSRFGYDSSINSAAITLNNSSNVEQIRFHFDQPTQTVRFRDAKNSFSNIGVSINTFSNIRKKVALKIDGTTLKVFSDGQQIGSDYTRPNAFDINSMDLQSSAFNLFETKFYNTTLSDAELQALTTL